MKDNSTNPHPITQLKNLLEEAPAAALSKLNQQIASKPKEIVSVESGREKYLDNWDRLWLGIGDILIKIFALLVDRRSRLCFQVLHFTLGITLLYQQEYRAAFTILCFELPLAMNEPRWSRRLAQVSVGFGLVSLAAWFSQMLF